MNDLIVQEVRDIRASIAEQFGYDRTRILAWARSQTADRKAVLSKAIANAEQETTAGLAQPPPSRKRRVRSADVSA